MKTSRKTAACITNSQTLISKTFDKKIKTKCKSRKAWCFALKFPAFNFPIGGREIQATNGKWIFFSAENCRLSSLDSEKKWKRTKLKFKTLFSTNVISWHVSISNVHSIDNYFIVWVVVRCKVSLCEVILHWQNNY